MNSARSAPVTMQSLPFSFLSTCRSHILKHYRVRHGHHGINSHIPCVHASCPCSFHTWNALLINLNTCHVIKTAPYQSEGCTFSCHFVVLMLKMSSKIFVQCHYLIIISCCFRQMQNSSTSQPCLCRQGFCRSLTFSQKVC